MINKDVNLKPSPELSYVIGVLFGDGTLDDNQKNSDYQIVLAQKDLNFAKVFSEAVSKVIGKKESYKIGLWRKRYYRVRAYSKILLKFLKRRELKRFTRIINAYPTEFIKGFVDSEGSVTISTNKAETKSGMREYLYCIITITNSSIEVINFVKEQLEKLGIESKVRKKKSEERVVENHIAHFRRDGYDILIRKLSSIERFQQLIGFRVTARHKKLQKFLALKRMEVVRRGRRWKQYWKDRVKRVCVYCGKEFEILAHEQRYFCSHDCLRKAGGNLKNYLRRFSDKPSP